MADGHVEWQHQVSEDGGDSFHGNPLILDRLILFGSDQSFRTPYGTLVALNLSSGEAAWQVRLGVGLATDLTRDGDRVLGVDLSDRLLAFDLHTGDTIWTRATPWEYDDDARMYEDLRAPTLVSSCAVREDVVCFAGRDQVVYGVEAESGAPLWQTRIPGRITTQLCAAGDEVVVGSDGYALHYLDFTTGQKTRTQALDIIPLKTMSWQGNALFLLGGFEDAKAVDLLCVDSERGDIRWRQSIPEHGDDPYWYVPRLHFWHDLVIVGSTDGLIVAYAAATGEERWRHQLQGAIRGIGSSRDMLFVGNLDGTLFALRR